MVPPVFREGGEDEPYFKENLSKALPRNLGTLNQLASHCSPQVHEAPRSGLRFRPLKRPTGGLFLLLAFTEEEVNQALTFIINLGQVQKAIQDYAHKALPAPTENHRNGAVPSQRNQILLKTRKRGAPKTNYCQNGRMPVTCSNHLHHCQISRDINLGSLVQIIAFTSKNPAGHKRGTVNP